MRRRLAGAILASLVSACGYGIVESVNKRLEGNCYAECTGDQICNLKTGLCETDACAGGCGPGRHCTLLGPGRHRCDDDALRIASSCRQPCSVDKVCNAATGLCERPSP